MDLYDIRKEFAKGKTIHDLPLRVTFYARVSTNEKEQIHSLHAQIKYYTDLIHSNPNWEYVEGYIDEGISGTSVLKRENFLQMIADSKSHKFDFILTKEISRFSRNTLDSIGYTQTLLENSVGVLFESDGINTLDRDSELRLTILSSIAQDEVRKISERVKFGFKRSIEKGVVLGNNSIWGYNKSNGKLVINEKEAEMVRIIFDLYANERLGFRKIGASLKEKGYLNSNGRIFTTSTLKRIITNPKYKGYYCGEKSHKMDYRKKTIKHIEPSKWIVYKDTDDVPPIIEETLWEKANCIFNNRSSKMMSDDRSSYHNKYSYSGKIICTKHNVTYHRSLYKYKSGDREVWNCKHYIEKGKAGCTSPAIYTKELDVMIKNILCDFIDRKDELIGYLIHCYSETNGNLQKFDLQCSTINEELLTIKKKKDRLLSLNIDGKVSDDEFFERNNELNDQAVVVKQKMQLFEEQRQLTDNLMETVEHLKNRIAQEFEFQDGFSNELIDELIDRIEVYPTDHKNKINLTVYLKVLSHQIECTIDRTKKTETGAV